MVDNLAKWERELTLAVYLEEIDIERLPVEGEIKDRLRAFWMELDQTFSIDLFLRCLQELRGDNFVAE